MTLLKVVCAWCGKDLGEKDGEGEEGISHGMCDECYAKEMEAKAEARAGEPYLKARR